MRQLRHQARARVRCSRRLSEAVFAIPLRALETLPHDWTASFYGLVAHGGPPPAAAPPDARRRRVEGSAVRPRRGRVLGRDRGGAAATSTPRTWTACARTATRSTSTRSWPSPSSSGPRHRAFVRRHYVFCLLAIGLSIFGWASYVDSCSCRERLESLNSERQGLLFVVPVAYVFATLLCERPSAL